MNANHVPTFPESVERDADADRAARRERWAGWLFVAGTIAVGLTLLVVALHALGAS
ncbi:hypothetical protein [Polymorphospora lycopeni]|uniref:Uncharacterized protein n=1 Tax=Polymorphospora lycopeni TaxID=3140240 RepID=A0ABV5CKM3_9ACTN